SSFDMTKPATCISSLKLTGRHEDGDVDESVCGCAAGTDAWDHIREPRPAGRLYRRPVSGDDRVLQKRPAPRAAGHGDRGHREKWCPRFDKRQICLAYH